MRVGGMLSLESKVAEGRSRAVGCVILSGGPAPNGGLGTHQRVDHSLVDRRLTSGVDLKLIGDPRPYTRLFPEPRTLHAATSTARTRTRTLHIISILHTTNPHSTRTGFFNIRQRIQAPLFLTSCTSFRRDAENLPRTFGLIARLLALNSEVKSCWAASGFMAIARGKVAARIAGPSMTPLPPSDESRGR